jgi:hypothetical protein
VLPILLVLTLAVVQVGLLVRDELIVVQAARAGARGKFEALTCSPRRRRGKKQRSSTLAGGPPYAR